MSEVSEVLGCWGAEVLGLLLGLAQALPEVGDAKSRAHLAMYGRSTEGLARRLGIDVEARGLEIATSASS